MNITYKVINIHASIYNVAGKISTTIIIIAILNILIQLILSNILLDNSFLSKD
jgi:hypothetical protein